LKKVLKFLYANIIGKFLVPSEPNKVVKAL